jgi:hypothetical protein
MIASFVLFAALASGVEIPSWRTVTLYTRQALENLDARFDLSPIRDGPRLTIVADRSEGIFDVVLEEGTRRETLPVHSVSAGNDPSERVLIAGENGACVRVRLAGAGIPFEAALEGAGREFDQEYVAVARAVEPSLRIFDSAEQEILAAYLPGSWDAGGTPVELAVAGSRPPEIRFGSGQFYLSIPRAPAGTDLLLLPRDGSIPTVAIRLQGYDRFLEIPLRCRPAADAFYSCEVSGAGRAFRRAGARLNR